MAADDQQKEGQENPSKNPWESGSNGSNASNGSNGKPSGPPHLDEFFKGLFKTKKKPSPGSNPSSNIPPNVPPKKTSEDFDFLSPKFLLGIVLVLILIWAGSGFYIVKPAEQGVILRLGQYIETVGPGPHWLPLWIETDQIVNTDQVSVIDQSGLMLTSEENLVQVDFVVKYRISDPKAYLFNTQDPINSLKEITNSAVRQVVGHAQLSDILTDDHSVIREAVEQEIKKLVAKYDLGLSIVDVDMQSASAPDQVKDAFDDVIKAREDQVTYINNSNTYADQVIPKAKGQAARILEQAQADQQQAILLAQGDAAEFNALLPQYQSAPQIMRERLYLDTMQQVLSGSHVVLVDSANNQGNVFYLPIPSVSDASSQANNLTSNLTATTQASTSQVTAASSANSSSTTANNSNTSMQTTFRNDYLRWQEAQNNAS